TSDCTAVEDPASSRRRPGLPRPTTASVSPASGRPPDRCANLFALYAPGAGKSIRAERARRGARRAHPHAQHAEREEQRAEQREGRGRRHGAASSAPSGYWSRRRPAPRGAEPGGAGPERGRPSAIALKLRAAEPRGRWSGGIGAADGPPGTFVLWDGHGRLAA